MKITVDDMDKYWLQLYQSLRKEGWFSRADQLREMLRRMGWEIRVTKEGIVAIEK